MEINEDSRYGAFGGLMLPSPRGVNASSSERSLLLGVISSHLGILDARDNDTRSLRYKSLIWDKITDQFNSLSSTQRTRQQIQTLYKNMKAKAKKYQMRYIESRFDSTGIPPPEPDPVSELLIQLLKSEVVQKRIYVKQTAQNISEISNLNRSNSTVVSSQISDHNTSDSVSSEQENQEKMKHSVIFDENSDHTEPGECLEEIQTSPKNIDKCIEAKLNPEKTLHPLLDFSESKSPNSFNFEKYSTSTKDFPKFKENDSIFLKEGLEIDSSRLFKIDKHIDTKNVTKYISLSEPSSEDFEAKVYSSTYPKICCPKLHDEILNIAKIEHDIKIKYYEEKRKMNAIKIELMELEKKVCERRLEIMSENEQLMEVEEKFEKRTKADHVHA